MLVRKSLLTAAAAISIGLGVLAFAADEKPRTDKPAGSPPATDTKPDEPKGSPLDSLKVGVEAKTPGGVTVVVTEESKSQGARDGDWVWVHYTGKLSTGEEFDSSVGREPLRFRLGKPGIIQGWNEGIIGMKLGEKRKLTIPPALGYGAEGHPPKIPANSTLIFDVELIGIARPG
jgi:FKBP-type peptidyl-prolyl cis-trans isomerase